MNRRLVFILLVAVYSCQEVATIRSIDTQALVKKCYTTSFVQTKMQVATGEVEVTFTNKCDNVSMTITQVGLGTVPILFGSKTTAFRKDNVIVPPKSSIVRTYNINVGNKVVNAYALKEGIQFEHK